MSDSDISDLTDEPVSEYRQTPKYPPPQALPQASLGRGEYVEARIASIEAHVDHMRDDLGDIRRDYRELTKTIITAGTDVRELDGRMSALPGKGWMFLAMLMFTAIICAVIIYIDQIREYLGVLPTTSTMP